MANSQQWWGIFHPIDGDPPDISFSLWERINVADRVKFARAQLAYTRTVLQAQLELINALESLANLPAERQ